LALAIVAGDDETFDRVWQWTDENLRRDDGLLAHHATADGAVDDDEAASDADVVTAWALLRADHNDEQRDAGLEIAEAVLERELAEVGDDRVLAAGPWATGSPATLNPSYWALPMFDDLAELTADDRWSDLADTSLDQLRALTNEGAVLPPDWARVDGDRVSPTPAPGGTAPDVRYSFDAQRVVVWCATADDGRELAASWWELVEGRDRRGAVALRPDGEVIDGAKQPLGYVAAAAAAFAAGEDDLGHRLLEKAAALDRKTPTYYGNAWVALGRALLTTDLLGGAQP
jgi:endoglucanase